MSNILSIISYLTLSHLPALSAISADTFCVPTGTELVFCKKNIVEGLRSESILPTIIILLNVLL